MAPPRRDEMKRSMEALILHFKLYTEGVPRAGRRGLRRRRGAEGRVRRLSRRRRHEKPYQLARSARRASPICRRWISSARAISPADVSGILGSLDIVFGEVDR